MTEVKEPKRRKNDLTLEFIETREMTEEEVNNVVSILFNWWKRGYERRMAEEAGKDRPIEPQPGIEWVI